MSGQALPFTRSFSRPTYITDRTPVVSATLDEDARPRRWGVEDPLRRACPGVPFATSLANIFHMYDLSNQSGSGGGGGVRVHYAEAVRGRRVGLSGNGHVHRTGTQASPRPPLLWRPSVDAAVQGHPVPDRPRTPCRCHLSIPPPSREPGSRASRPRRCSPLFT